MDTRVTVVSRDTRDIQDRPVLQAARVRLAGRVIAVTLVQAHRVTQDTVDLLVTRDTAAVEFLVTQDTAAAE